MSSNMSDDLNPSWASHGVKFKGLLPRSRLRTIRHAFLNFVDYAYAISVGHFSFVFAFQWYYMIQLLMVSLAPLDPQIWFDTSAMSRLVRVLAVIAYLAPAGATSDVNLAVAGAVFVIFIAALVLLICGVVSYHLYRHAPIFVSDAFVIGANAVIPSFLNLFASLTGRCASFAIAGVDPTLNITIAVVGLVFALICLLFAVSVLCPSLVFRPQTIHILYTHESLLFHLSITIFELLLPMAAGISGKTGCAFELIGIVPLSIALFIAWKSFAWGSPPFRWRLFLVLAICALLCAFSGGIRLSGSSGLEAELFVVIVIFFGFSMLIGSGLFDSSAASERLLSGIASGEISIAELSYSKLLNLLRFGFDNGHAICHSWDLFAQVSERFPGDRRLAVMYLRYAAIYPGDSAALTAAATTLASSRGTVREARLFLRQMRWILQCREHGYSKVLRRWISDIMVRTEQCRGEIRHILECVLQQKIGQVERIATSLRQIEVEIVDEYTQLSLLYATNPYVASSFAAFLHDILRRDSEAASYAALYRSLREGEIEIDAVLAAAANYIPTLPSEADHRAASDAPRRRPDEPRNTEAPEPLVGEDVSQHRRLETMVAGARIPVAAYGPVLLVLSISVLFPVAAIVLVVVSLDVVAADLGMLAVNEPLSRLAIALVHLPIAGFQLALSELGKAATLEACARDFVEQSWRDWGVAVHESDRETLVRAVRDVVEPLQQAASKMHEFSDRVGLHAAIWRFVAPDRELVESAAGTAVPTNLSIEQALTSFASRTVRLADMDGAAILQDSEFWAMVANSERIDGGMLEYADSLSNALNGLFAESTDRLFFVIDVTLGLAAAIAVVTYGIVTYHFEKQKSYVFNSFKSLGSSDVSGILRQLNDQSGKEAEDDTQGQLAPQEEHTLRLLSAPVTAGKGDLAWRTAIRHRLLLAVYVVCVAVVFVMFHTTVSGLFEVIESVGPFYRSLSGFHTRLGLAFLYLTRAVVVLDPQLAPFSADNLTTLTISGSQALESAYVHIEQMRFGDWRQKMSQLSDLHDRIGAFFSDAGFEPAQLWVNGNAISVLSGMSYDNAISFTYDTLNRLFDGDDAEVGLAMQELSMTAMWLLRVSYPSVLDPALSWMTSYLTDVVYRGHRADLLVPIFVCAFVIFAVGLALVPGFNALTANVHWVLHLLLFLDPATVFKSRQFFKILSNGLPCLPGDDFEESQEFFERICAGAPDPMLFLDAELTIRSCNRASLAFFERPAAQLLNRTMFEVLSIGAAPTPETTAFVYAAAQATQSIRAPCIEHDIELDFRTGPRRIRASLVAVAATGAIPTHAVLTTSIALFTLVLRPLPPEIIAHEKLIAEREKVEVLLTNVLADPVIRLRRAHPEKRGIAFSVEHAVFLFIELLPSDAWGPPRTDRDVIATLDDVFGAFDRVLAGYPELVKLKRINGTYVAGGGLFSQAAGPKVPAKQAVLAALGMIATLGAYNVAAQINLKAVCGVWLQPLVVAALVELPVPTFELFGIPLDTVSDMARSGNQMDVIVSPSIYELIYGPNDRIREGKVITVGEKPVQTYIVKAVEGGG
jgi:PAS domain-containing protein